MKNIIFCAFFFTCFSSLTAQEERHAQHEKAWRGGDFPRGKSFLEQIGEIHSPFPKTKLLEGEKSYFELLEKSQKGDEVVGKIHLANNSFEDVELFIVGGNGEDYFSIEKYQTSIGKSYGVLHWSQNEQPDLTKYDLIVQAVFPNGVIVQELYTIHIVREILAEKFLSKMETELKKGKRLDNEKPDRLIADYLSKMNGEGSFVDFPWSDSQEGWINTCNSAARLLSIAIAYTNNESAYYLDEKIKQRLYSGIIWNADKNNRFRSQWYDTHVWRNSDYIAGIGIRLFRLLRDEINSGDEQQAKQADIVYESILDVCDNLWAERMFQRPAIANANRTHRMRSLAVRAAISYDYNRAITDQEVWYDIVDSRIPGFYPDGAFDDLMELMETNFPSGDTYINKNGFFPDGTICHHPAVGIQFTAGAYGWGQLTEWSIKLADFFKNTRFQAKNETYNVVTERLLDAYRPLMFQGYLDMNVAGMLGDRGKWGKMMLEAVNGLLNAKSKNTIIKRENELLGYMESLQSKSCSDQLILNKAYWNIDMMVHQRPDYLASVKMISKRSRGLERGIERRSYHYLGDGSLFLRKEPDDFNQLEYHYNWHAIPGITAEQRQDVLPPYADSPYEGANGTNTFAGVVSDGLYGIGAFKYERNHTNARALYSTVNANKAYFFFENEIVALGNSVERVRPGDHQDIWTVLDQREWRTDIVFNIGSGEEKIKINSKNKLRTTDDINHPVWFFHDGIGYVIVPDRKPLSLQLSAEQRKESYSTKEGGTKKIFQLIIDHGKDPHNDSYQYILLPGVTPDYLQNFVQSYSEKSSNIEILRNDEEVIAVNHKGESNLQVAFYEAGELEVPGFNGFSLNLSTDRPALVMIRKLNDGLMSFSVTDPQHSQTDAEIKLLINMNLTGPNCKYSAEKGQSELSFKHSLEEVLAGKPMTKKFKIPNEE